MATETPQLTTLLPSPARVASGDRKRDGARRGPGARHPRQGRGRELPRGPVFLPRAWRDDLMAVYGFARLVDDIGDGDLAPGGADARLLGVGPAARPTTGSLMLDAFEADLAASSTAHPPATRCCAGSSPPSAAASLTPEPFLGLIEANRQDQLVERYETYDELLAYCALSANPVGHLVLAVTGATTPERVRHSDAICTALQIVEHLQDVAEDLARDRDLSARRRHEALPRHGGGPRRAHRRRIGARAGRVRDRARPESAE